MRNLAWVPAVWGVHFCVGPAIGGDAPPSLVDGSSPGRGQVNFLDTERTIAEGGIDQIDELDAFIIELPPAKHIHTHVYRNGSITSRVEEIDIALPRASRAGMAEELVYSNTGGQKMLRFNVPNRRYADDIQSDALNDCPLSRYLVRVNGGVANGTGQFTCKVSLFTACPSPSGGGVLIPGTDATFSGLLDDSANYHDLIVDVSQILVPIPPALWVRVECNTAEASWVGNSFAEVGYSRNRFYFPNTGCDSFLGPNFVSNFYAQIWVANDPFDPCPTQYPAYATTPPTVPIQPNNTSYRFADDFETGLAATGDTCLITAYEVIGYHGTNYFSIETDLRVPFTDEAIPGTKAVFAGFGGTRAVFRHTISPGNYVVAPAEPLWVTWKSDIASASLLLAGGPANGWTDSAFWIDGCSPNCPFEAQGTFYLRVFCAGEEATGACCTPGPDDGQVCQDHITAQNCTERRWMRDATCAEPPFDPPCGIGACCTPQEACLELTLGDCDALSGVWNGLQTCAVAGPSCGVFACYQAAGACNLSHDSVGCNVRPCCNAVCTIDPTCCTESWDLDCLRVAAGLLECSSPPNGSRCLPNASVPDAAPEWLNVPSSLFADNRRSTDLSIGQLLFRFVAADTSARLSTCGTIPGDAANSVLYVGKALDSTNMITICNSTKTVACNDDRAGCGDGTMSDVCVTGLIPGEAYYVTLGSKMSNDRGIYHLAIESPCPSEQLAGPCTEGVPLWISPVSGTLDARQPLDPLMPGQPLGIMAITVQAPLHGDDPACWTLCDTLGNPQANEVLAIESHDDETSTLHLAQPLTPGAQTIISYANQGGCSPAMGSFAYLPGDFTGFNGTIVNDDGYYFDYYCLDGGVPVITERCDLDRSGTISSEDYVRLIDLFNGAGPFDPWLGRTISTAPCE